MRQYGQCIRISIGWYILSRGRCIRDIGDFNWDGFERADNVRLRHHNELLDRGGIGTEYEVSDP